MSARLLPRELQGPAFDSIEFRAGLLSETLSTVRSFASSRHDAGRVSSGVAFRTAVANLFADANQTNRIPVGVLRSKVLPKVQPGLFCRE
jgi:hypothetical protein